MNPDKKVRPIRRGRQGRPKTDAVAYPVGDSTSRIVALSCCSQMNDAKTCTTRWRSRRTECNPRKFGARQNSNSRGPSVSPPIPPSPPPLLLYARFSPFHTYSTMGRIQHHITHTQSRGSYFDTQSAPCLGGNNTSDRGPWGGWLVMRCRCRCVHARVCWPYDIGRREAPRLKIE